MPVFTQNVWNTWNTTQTGGNLYLNTSTNSISVSDNFDRADHQLIWGTWTDVGTVSSTVFDNTWTNWYNTIEPVYRPAAAFITPQRTETEWAAIRQENERLRAERDVLQAAARTEAARLMELVLSDEQIAQYKRNRYFDVVGSEGSVFRIHHGVSGNVRQVVDGQEINGLCAHPKMLDHRTDEGEGAGYLPTEDCMVAQALSLMHDESVFVQTANVHWGPRRHLEVVRSAA